MNISLVIMNAIYKDMYDSAKKRVDDLAVDIEQRVFKKGDLEGNGQVSYRSESHKNKRRAKGLQIGFVDLNFTSKLKGTLRVVDLSKKAENKAHFQIRVGENYVAKNGVTVLEQLSDLGYNIKVTRNEVDNLVKDIKNDLRP